jgi:hypothetical protein
MLHKVVGPVFASHWRGLDCGNGHGRGYHGYHGHGHGGCVRHGHGHGHGCGRRHGHGFVHGGHGRGRCHGLGRGRRRRHWLGVLCAVLCLGRSPVVGHPDFRVTACMWSHICICHA